jgi:hypothetical protein
MIWKLIIVLTIIGLMFGIVLAGVFSNVIADFFEIQKADLKESDSLNILWKINLADQLISTPQVQGNVIFIQTRHKVTAINYITREKIWEFSIEGHQYNCQLVATTNYLFVPSVNGLLVALDTKTGKELWSRPKGLGHERFEDIQVQKDYIILAIYDGILESRNTISGEIIWQVPASERSTLHLMIIENIILLSSNGQIKAYELSDGKVLWSRNLDLGISLFVPGENMVFAHESRQNSEWISGIDPFSGETIWTKQIPIAKVNCIVNNKDYLLLAGEGLIFFDLRSKQIEWENKTIDRLTCPIILREKIYVRKELRDLYIYDSLSGILESRYTLNWSLFLNSNKYIDPVLIENMIILPKYRNSLVIVNTEKN